MKRPRLVAKSSVLTMVAVVSAGCPGGSGSGGGTTTVQVDGSSTVFPLSEAVAEEFGKANPEVRVTVGLSGTGGGFTKLGAREVDLIGASRPIGGVEVEAFAQSGVEFVELAVAYDGIVIVVNPKNTWVDHITVEELRRIWEPDAQGKVLKWSDVRPGWPDQALRLYGAGVDSGTYDYFTAAVVGTEHASRGDFTSSEDDNVLVQGVSRDEQALGFFGFAYYEENRERLKAVPVDDGEPENGAGPIAPSVETIRDSTYQPLTRPIFIYVQAAALQRPEVKSFVTFYLTNGSELAREVGYIPLPPSAYALMRARADAAVTGSVFGGSGSMVGARVEDVFGEEPPPSGEKE